MNGDDAVDKRSRSPGHTVVVHAAAHSRPTSMPPGPGWADVAVLLDPSLDVVACME